MAGGRAKHTSSETPEPEKTWVQKQQEEEPFVGVDEIYRNAADSTGLPYVPSEGPEREAHLRAIENEKARTEEVGGPDENKPVVTRGNPESHLHEETDSEDNEESQTS